MKWWDKSWNPLYGCTKCSDGCDNCVALDNLQKQHRCLLPSVNENVLHNHLGSNLNYIVGSLGDLFHEDHSCENIDKVFQQMAKFPKNRYFIQTKKSKELKEYFSDEDLPENIRDNEWNSLWMGVTVESSKYLDRIDDLLNTPFIKHRFVCLEPLLEKVFIKKYLSSDKIDWVIVGGESGEHRRYTENEWIHSIIEECREFKVPVYVDQMNIDNDIVGEIEKFPTEFQVREFPWKNPKSEEGYQGVYVLNNSGWIGIKDSHDYFEFMIKAPEFVFFEMNGKEPSKKMTPLSFPDPKGPFPARRMILKVRDLVKEIYPKLLNNGVPDEEANMIVPRDVLVQFKWNLKKENAISFLEELHRGKSPELQIYTNVMIKLIKEKK